MLITQFGEKHEACPDGVQRALDLGCRTMDEIWAHPEFDPEDRLWLATSTGALSDKELRLFAVWCARQVQHLTTDQRSLDAIDIAERYAYGEATDEELMAARDAAWDATRGVAWSASGAAAWNASWSAARRAALSAAWESAREAARSASWSAAWDAQARWLIENTNPNWEA